MSWGIASGGNGQKEKKGKDYHNKGGAGGRTSIIDQNGEKKHGMATL